MKKRYLKRWVEITLYLIMVICLLILVSEIDSISILITKIISLLILGSCTYLLNNYTKEN